MRKQRSRDAEGDEDRERRRENGQRHGRNSTDGYVREKERGRPRSSDRGVWRSREDRTGEWKTRYPNHYRYGRRWDGRSSAKEQYEADRKHRQMSARDRNNEQYLRPSDKDGDLRVWDSMRERGQERWREPRRRSRNRRDRHISGSPPKSPSAGEDDSHPASEECSPPDRVGTLKVVTTPWLCSTTCSNIFCCSVRVPK